MQKLFYDVHFQSLHNPVLVPVSWYAKMVGSLAGIMLVFQYNNSTALPLHKPKKLRCWQQPPSAQNLVFVHCRRFPRLFGGKEKAVPMFMFTLLII